MKVITRFAPSPTGYLHIGSARTALFNYLFAKKHNGKFLLRIEDTDQARLNDEAGKTILTSLKWLDINWDGEIIYQSSRAARHQEVAKQLLDSGKAYYCFTPQEEINRLREEAKVKKEPFIFSSPWREKQPDQYPTDIKPVVRLKVPRQVTDNQKDSDYVIVKDALQGEVKVKTANIDDMILLRSDGTPTYMLAVVVDDHDMGITHIIRGDDHLSNAPKQQLIYQALGWQVPIMVHIPLIHSDDGTKLSKRHGALGVEYYRESGYLPEALNNYLLRLGWSYGNHEFINRSDAIKWFNIEGLGKAPARLDFAKMRNLNAQYLRATGNEKLQQMLLGFLPAISSVSQANILNAMDLLKSRVHLLTELAEDAKIFIVEHPLIISEEARAIIAKCNLQLIQEIIVAISNITDFNKDNIQDSIDKVAQNNNLKLPDIMPWIRAFITGKTSSPSIFTIMTIIGKECCLERLNLLN